MPETPPIAARLPFFYGWVIVAVAFVTIALGVTARTSFSLLFPPIVAEFGWDRATATLPVAVATLMSGLFQPIVGQVVDQLETGICISRFEVSRADDLEGKILRPFLF